jgi:hypothetical protein
VDAGVGGAAPDREVVAADHHPAAVDAPGACHQVGGRQRPERPVRVVLPKPGEGADLVKGARVEEPLDAFPDGQPAGVVLAPDPLLAAHPASHLLSTAQLFELRAPGHAGIMVTPCMTTPQNFQFCGDPG